jgi:hypothetical protein
MMMPRKYDNQKLAVEPIALAIPIKMPAKRGAMSRWLTRKPLYWKPQNARPIVMKEIAPRHWVQSIKPFAATIHAGTIAPTHRQVGIIASTHRQAGTIAPTCRHAGTIASTHSQAGTLQHLHTDTLAL